MASVEQVVRVQAPSRLHFGMFSFADPARRQFGGVGVMIDRPGLRLRIAPSRRWAAADATDRVEQFARRWAEYRGVDSILRRIEVAFSSSQHVGLGVGTQLALAVGAGLDASHGFAPMTPVELARCMGRGQRSAVGTYGFFQGGLLIDEGKLPGESLSPLRERIAMPLAWRIVLLRPRGEAGLHGEDERHAFRDLPPPPEPVTSRLWDLVEARLAPAVRQGDFQEFSESVYQFGMEAGMCFAPRQGGPFASDRIARWVAELREMGVRGVGQSSWGPTVFAFLPDQNSAEALVRRFRAAHASEALELMIAAPNNTGARIEIGEE